MSYAQQYADRWIKNPETHLTLSAYIACLKHNLEFPQVILDNEEIAALKKVGDFTIIDNLPEVFLCNRILHRRWNHDFTDEVATRLLEKIDDALDGGASLSGALFGKADSQQACLYYNNAVREKVQFVVDAGKDHTWKFPGQLDINRDSSNGDTARTNSGNTYYTLLRMVWIDDILEVNDAYRR